MKATKCMKRTLALVLSFCTAFSAVPAGTQTVQAAENELSFTPKRIFIESAESPVGTWLGDMATLVSQEFVATGICESLPVVYGESVYTEAGDIILYQDEEPGVVGGGTVDSYSLRTDGQKITVTAKYEEDLMYGLRDILKTLKLGKAVEDKMQFMDVGQRIFHLDCGRKYFSKDWILSLIRELSWLEMNQLELDFSNGTGFRLGLDDMSLDVNGETLDLSVLLGGATDPDSWLTQEEMDEIIETAGRYGIEIVPCLDTPGHMGWIFSKEGLDKYSSNEELDVESEEATAFARALVGKFAQYFVSRGCTTFHIGGDEYLHGYVGWLGHPESTEGKYEAVATYLDTLAGELKQMGYQKIRSFNDPLYYKKNTSYKWKNVDESEYWCYTGMNGFNYASPAFQAEQGLHMINGHGDFYGILSKGDLNFKELVGDAGTKKTPAGLYAQFHNNHFAQGAEVDDEHVWGSTYFLWCDDPTAWTTQEVTASLYPRLRAASAKMCDEDASGTWQEFAATFTDSVGGFRADGTLQSTELPPASKIRPVTEVIQEEKDQEAAQAVISQIEALGTITLESREQLVAASSAYAALTEEQKKLVPAEIRQILTKAQDTLAALEKQQEEQKPEPKPEQPPVSLKKGEVFYDGNCKYQVLKPASAGTAGTAAFAGVKKAAATVKIPARVSAKGGSYEVTEIKAKAVRKNKKLAKLTIGANVKKIGASAFYNCKKLKTITVSTRKLTAASVGSRAFGKISAKAVIKVPKPKKAAYKKFLYKKGFPKTGKIK